MLSHQLPRIAAEKPAVLSRRIDPCASSQDDARFRQQTAFERS